MTTIVLQTSEENNLARGGKAVQMRARKRFKLSNQNELSSRAERRTPSVNRGGVPFNATRLCLRLFSEMASSGVPSLYANEPHKPSSFEETSPNAQSSDEYNCQLIPHLPMSYGAGQVNRLVHVQCPSSENDFVQVDHVAAHPSASATPTHECYAVVTSSRRGALLAHEMLVYNYFV